MKRHTRLLLKFVLGVTFLTPSLCWAQNALIVHDGTAGIEADVLGNLTSKLTAAGFTVTPNVGVPGGSLAGYQQVWDIRFNTTTPLTGPDITAYVAYLAGGGSLFVMGENTGFATRNDSIVVLIASAGGGAVSVITPLNLETVNSPFTGPNVVTSVTFQAAAGIASPPGRGACVTQDAGSLCAAIVWSPGYLTNAAAGTLIVVFDVNFLQAGASADLQNLTSNLIAYLAAPVPVAPPVPAPPSLVLVLIGGCGVVAYEVRRRYRARAV